SVTEQYRSGLYRARAPRRGRLPVHAVHAEVIHQGADVTTLQRAWAAGFLDAEGSFGLVRGRTRKDGSPWFRIRASADQHGEIGTAADVLVKLHDIVGTGRIERHGAPDDYKWVVEGQPAIEQVVSVVGPYLSQVKLRQAEIALEKFTAQKRLKGDAVRCVRGHLYTGHVSRAGWVKHVCLGCERITDSRRGAAPGLGG